MKKIRIAVLALVIGIVGMSSQADEENCHRVFCDTIDIETVPCPTCNMWCTTTAGCEAGACVWNASLGVYQCKCWVLYCD